ncbi:MAG: hypothetical protein WDN45_18120, partial [Caulobacteraceae bacterium]
MGVTLQRTDKLVESANKLVDGDGKRALSSLADAAESLKDTSRKAQSLLGKLEGPTSDFAHQRPAGPGLRHRQPADRHRIPQPRARRSRAQPRRPDLQTAGQGNRGQAVSRPTMNTLSKIALAAAGPPPDARRLHLGLPQGQAGA